MVEREVEVPLDLPRVQVDRHDPVGAGGREQVGHELGADRLARQPLVVLPRVAVVRDDRGDALAHARFMASIMMSCSMIASLTGS